MASQRPMIGMWKSRWKSAPNASMMVRIRMVKPHMVKKWAVPGTDHCSSFFWPATSTSSAFRRFGTSLARLGTAGCPEAMSRPSQKNRRAAMASITKKITSPMEILTATAVPPRSY